MYPSSEQEIELIDLGDATEETRQLFYIQMHPDSMYVWGYRPG